MTQDAHYFRIGLFILGTLALGAAGIIWIGATNFFQPSALVETCFDESVQGLEVGAPVKFRGIEIGSVVAIESAGAVYHNELPEGAQEEFGRYIIVTMKITAPQFFEERTSRLKQARIDAAVQRGFRVRQNLLGLSGASFINADFVDPALFPPLEITWRPRYSYIPSAPSSLPKIVESAGQFFGALGSSDLIGNLDRLLVTLDAGLRSADVPRLVEASALAAESLARTSQDVQRLLGAPELERLPEEVAGAVSGIRELVELLDEELPVLIHDLQLVGERSRSLVEGPDMERILANTAGISDDLQKVTEELPGLLEDLQRVLRRVDRVAAGAEGGFEELALDVRRVVGHLERLASDLRANPSQSLFGDPPPEGPQ